MKFQPGQTVKLINTDQFVDSGTVGVVIGMCPMLDHNRSIVVPETWVYNVEYAKPGRWGVEGSVYLADQLEPFCQTPIQ